MLSRIAESLFWIGRYLERADDTARILDVHLQMLLEDPFIDEQSACIALLSVMGVGEGVAVREGEVVDRNTVLDRLAYDRTNSSSIVARSPPPGRTPAGPGKPSPRRCGSTSTPPGSGSTRPAPGHHPHQSSSGSPSGPPWSPGSPTRP